MSLEFILQLADSTCHNRLSSGLIDRDSDSFLSTSWTYEDGWKLLLHDTYYTTSSTTQNTLTSCLSKQQRVPRFDIYLWFGCYSLTFVIPIRTWDSGIRRPILVLAAIWGRNEVMVVIQTSSS